MIYTKEQKNQYFISALKHYKDKVKYGKTKEFALNLKIDPNSLTLIIKNERQLSEKKQIFVANALGYSYEDFLLFGKSILEGTENNSCEEEKLQTKNQEEKYISIPFYKNYKVAAGSQLFSNLLEPSKDDPVIIYRPALGDVSPKSLAAFPVDGSSMEPTINRNGIIIVNLKDRFNIIDNKIYMVLRPETKDAAVKRVQVLTNNQLLLLSDNTKYKPQVIDTEGKNLIIGRVIWSSQHL